MKNLMLVLAFFGMLVLLADTQPMQRQQNQATVYFGSELEADAKKPAIEISSVEDGEFSIHFYNFADNWSSWGGQKNIPAITGGEERDDKLKPANMSRSLAKAMNNIEFKADHKDCHFLQSAPILFHCQSSNMDRSYLSKLRVGGRKIYLESLTSSVLAGNHLQADGKVYDNSLYAVSVVLRFGGKKREYTLFTQTKQVHNAIMSGRAIAKF